MKILDLFCGDGGAAIGLHRAFPAAEIVGIDIEDHSAGYPFQFVQADAMVFPLEGYDFIWASPPCQGYSVMRHLPWNKHRNYPLLIAPTLDRLRAQPAPYILENVMGARPVLPNALWLCGMMFGKRFYRHRLFETNFAWFQPLHPTHAVNSQRIPNRGITRNEYAIFEQTSRTRNTLLLQAPVRFQKELRAARQHGTLMPNILGEKHRRLAAWQQAVAERGDVLAVGHSGKQTKTTTASFGTEVAVGQNTLSHARTSLIEAARREMELPGMSAAGLSQAIPPCYSEYLAQFIPT